LDEGGPGAFEAFAGEFFGGVDAELGADGDVGGGVVEDVGGATGEDGVALGVGVGAEVEEDFAGVVDVDVGIDDDHVFGEHHLAHAPEAVHDFVGLHGVGFFDADKDEVVKNAFGRKGDIDNLGKVHLKDGEEQFHAGTADVEILHGRDADNGGGVDGVLAMGDGGDVKDGVRLGQGVVAGVVAEGAFHAERFLGVDVAFDDKVRIGRNHEVVGLTFDEFDRFFAEVTGEEEFVEAVRERRGCAESKHGVATDEDGDGHALAGFVIAASVTGGDFLELPVHAGGLGIVNLDAVHADVAIAGVGVLGDDAGESDETAAVVGPAFQNGQVEEGRGCCVLRVACPGLGDRWSIRPGFGAGGGGIEAVDDVLARAGADGFGLGVAEVEGGAEEFQGFAQAGGGLGLHESAEFGGGGIDGFGADAHGHATMGAESVDGDGEWGELPIYGRFFDEERLAAIGRLHFAIGEFGDFQFGGNGLRDALKLARLLERAEEVAKGVERHNGERLARGGGRRRGWKMEGGGSCNDQGSRNDWERPDVG
jgi:hypothetical protein